VNDSLSIIVPVRNVEATLTEQIGQLLEVLPDLTNRFEIVVVDDGSTDHTVELARELAREYAQLRLIRHVQPRGMELAVKTGLQWAQGQTVFVQDNPACHSPTNLRRLWSLRHDRQAAQACTQSRPGRFHAGLLERLTTWGQSLKNAMRSQRAGGIRMVRGAAAETLAAAGIDACEMPAIPLPHAETARRDAAHSPRSQRRPKATFLEHLRDLAVGE
jgi:glycosyltransferase involved in cell wall biosynthesis